MASEKTDAYADAGVDISAGNDAVSRYRELLGGRRDPRILEGIGAFAGCFDFRGYRDPVLVASTDGVGTKVLVAAALGRFDSVGRDLVHHCINDIACVGARPLFFLDYLAVGKLDPATAASIVAGVARACGDFQVALLGGETAEMPGVYAPGIFDIAGTIVGAVERSDMVDTSRVEIGDAIVGLPANGLHTNGYSLARRVLPPQRFGDRLNGETIGDALLAVHPCYLPSIDALREAGVTIKAMAHITGGGLIENVPRVLPDHAAARFDRSTWTVPAIEALIVREAGLAGDEPYRVLNMGVGFCIIVRREDARRAVDAVAHGQPPLAASIVGEVEPRHSCGPAVIIS